MRVEQLLWTKKNGWKTAAQMKDADLVIYFAGKAVLSDSGAHFNELKAFYPKAHIVGGSTGGEIYAAEVLDDSVVCAAIKFKNTPLRTASVELGKTVDSLEAGRRLATALNAPDLRYIFLLSDGIHMYGSYLVQGLYDVLDSKVIVTGGLAGDGADFKQTLVGLDAPPAERQVVAVGLYGDALQVGYGSVGGWSPFGPERKVTRAKGNVLYELDNKPALDLYKQYLGDDAKNLPASGLLFPLSIRPERDSEHEIVRTVMAIDEAEKSMVFAGDIPEGYIAQLMQGNSDNLVEGAVKAAELASIKRGGNDALAILVSCIGRKLLLGQFISDEVEAVAGVFKNKIPTVGFYSYGEICHQQFTNKCSLHNQTMTVTVLHEKA
jgi:hypothetical protein